jgi:hypothetical protein
MSRALSGSVLCGSSRVIFFAPQNLHAPHIITQFVVLLDLRVVFGRQPVFLLGRQIRLILLGRGYDGGGGLARERKILQKIS